MQSADQILTTEFNYQDKEKAGVISWKPPENASTESAFLWKEVITSEPGQCQDLYVYYKGPKKRRTLPRTHSGM